MKKSKSSNPVTVTMYSVTELNKIKKLLEDNGYRVNAVPLSMDEAHLVKEKYRKAGEYT